MKFILAIILIASGLFADDSGVLGIIEEINKSNACLSSIDPGNPGASRNLVQEIFKTDAHHASINLQRHCSESEIQIIHEIFQCYSQAACLHAKKSKDFIRAAKQDSRYYIFHPIPILDLSPCQLKPANFKESNCKKAFGY